MFECTHNIGSMYKWFINVQIVLYTNTALYARICAMLKAPCNFNVLRIVLQLGMHLCIACTALVVPNNVLHIRIM
jgi:hypothetical protein